jgi:hypothetical protein
MDIIVVEFISMDIIQVTALIIMEDTIMVEDIMAEEDTTVADTVVEDTDNLCYCCYNSGYFADDLSSGESAYCICDFGQRLKYLEETKGHLISDEEFQRHLKLKVFW